MPVRHSSSSTTTALQVSLVDKATQQELGVVEISLADVPTNQDVTAWFDLVAPAAIAEAAAGAAAPDTPGSGADDDTSTHTSQAHYGDDAGRVRLGIAQTTATEAVAGKLDDYRAWLVKHGITPQDEVVQIAKPPLVDQAPNQLIVMVHEAKHLHVPKKNVYALPSSSVGVRV